MEKEIDGMAMRVADMRNMLLNLAREEAEKTKDEIVSEATRLAQEALEQIKTELGKEAGKIISNGEEELKSLRVRVEEAGDEAVSMVVKAALGE